MNFNVSNKKFISETDRYLQAFNSAHPKTKSQCAELAKHQDVFLKRDKAIVQKKSEAMPDIWEGF